MRVIYAPTPPVIDRLTAVIDEAVSEGRKIDRIVLTKREAILLSKELSTDMRIEDVATNSYFDGVLIEVEQ